MSDAPRDILTIDQAAELLGVSVKTFNKVLHNEPIPARKIGREWKFSRQALIDWVGSGVSLDFYRESSPNGNGTMRSSLAHVCSFAGSGATGLRIGTPPPRENRQ